MAVVAPDADGVVRAAVFQSVLPAAMSEAADEGGCQVFGSSQTNVEAGINPAPPTDCTLRAKTRYPLTLPSVPLNRKVTVFVPAMMVPAGKFMVIWIVWNPPPMPP